MSRAIQAVAIFGVLALGTACSDGITAPRGPAATITLPAGGVLLDAVGRTTRLPVVAVDDRGNPIAPSTLDWGTSDPGVVTVDQGGNVTAVSDGEATIFAALGDNRASTVVTVRAKVEFIVRVANLVNRLINPEKAVVSAIATVRAKE